MATDTIVRVDPKTLRIGPNVRKNTKLSPEFVKSIKEIGVRTPIVAVETEDGLEVVDGQRRTLGAIEAKLLEVPVFVTATQTAAERIVDQVVVNEQRAEIDEIEGIEAVRELMLFDVAVPAIIEQTGLSEMFVTRAAKVGASAAAVTSMADHQLSFDTALLVAEFEDSPTEQAELLEIAKKGQAWQVRERAEDMLNARELAKLGVEIVAAGMTLIEEPDYDSEDPRRLDRLFVDKALDKRLDQEDHDRVVELAGDGLRAYPTRGWVNGEYSYRIAYAVAGWRERGLFGRDYGSTPTPATPEDAEKLKAERRLVRENTKTWLEISVARIEFIQSLIARKVLPKGWEPIVAARMLDNAGSFSTSQIKMMLTILKLEQGTDSYSLRAVIQRALHAAPTRAPQIMLAIELGCVEGGLEFERKGWQFASAVTHLNRLAGWGYSLSPLEQSIVAAAAKKGKKAA